MKDYTPYEPVGRTCTTCVLCLRDDYGYSNYTVEGTQLRCLAGLNPDMEGADEPYWVGDMTPKLAAALDVAKDCPKYRAGAPATLDVEHDGIPYGKPATADMVKRGGYTDDDEAAELLAALLNADRS